MDPVHDMLLEMMIEEFTVERLLAITLIKQAHQQGLITKEDRFLELVDDLASQIAAEVASHNESPDMSINFGDDFIDLERSSIQRAEGFDLHLEEEDIREAESALQVLVSTATKELLGDLLPQNLLDNWKAAAPDALKAERNDAQNLCQDVNRVWGKALDSLEMLLSVCIEVGDKFNNILRLSKGATIPVGLDVLTRLHARGCQISREICVLLKNGLADGAHARWRTLHEVSVVATVIAENGNELAQRYKDHIHIQDYWSKNAYLNYCAVEGLEPPTLSEIKELDDKRDEVIRRYGGSFDQEYGWAANVVKWGNPTFEKLEALANVGHQRFGYKVASFNIHGGVKGIAFRLSAKTVPDELVVGQTTYGLGDPARATAFALTLLTVRVILSQDGLAELVEAKAIRDLMDNVVEAVNQAEATLYEESNRT